MKPVHRWLFPDQPKTARKCTVKWMNWFPIWCARKKKIRKKKKATATSLSMKKLSSCTWPNTDKSTLKSCWKKKACWKRTIHCIPPPTSAYCTTLMRHYVRITCSRKTLITSLKTTKSLLLMNIQVVLWKAAAGPKVCIRLSKPKKAFQFKMKTRP